MSDPLENAARDWFKKGSEALKKENWDFAAECFFNSIKMQPDNKVFRQTRHGSLEKMYDNNGTGGRMASMRLMTVRGKIKKSKMQKNWKAVDLAAEEGLGINPWDAQLYAELGESAVQQENMDVAQYAWGKAVKYDRANIAYNRALGKVLRECGEYMAARDCFKRIYEADPKDAEARAMMSKLDAESVMDRGGYERAESTRDVKTEKEAPRNAYEEDRKARKGQQSQADAPGESIETDLRHAIRKDADNINHYLRLADYYRKERNLPSALELYNQALEKDDGNTDILELKEDVELDLLRDKLADASELARKNPEKKRPAEKVAALKKQLIVRELEIFEPRIERHPQNMKMRFELADRYRRTKQYKRAIPLYQQAVADIRLSHDALVWLGECFVRNNQLKLAQRQFVKALDALNAGDHPDPFKRAHYWLGRIAEKARSNDEAETHYTEILSVDYSYLDVQRRLEELQGASGTFDDGEDLTDD